MNRMGKEFLGNESGAVAVICAALLVVFCGFAALAIDLGQIVYVRRELTKAAEAGAMSGARGLWPVDLSIATSRDPNVSNADTKARTTATNNLPTPKTTDVFTDVVTVEVGRWDYINTFTVDHVTPNGVRVTIRRNNIPTTFFKPFLALLGTATQKPIDIERRATAVMDFVTTVGMGSLPIAINLDNAKIPGDPVNINFNNDSGTEDHGGWFAKAPESASASTFKDYIDNGSCPPLKIGDTLNLQNGAVDSVLQDLKKKLATHPGGWEVLLPAVDIFKFSGTDQIDSFVRLLITDVGTGQDKYIKGKILTLGETQSGLPGPVPGTGVLAPPKLVL